MSDKKTHNLRLAPVLEKFNVFLKSLFQKSFYVNHECVSGRYNFLELTFILFQVDTQLNQKFPYLSNF